MTTVERRRRADTAESRVHPGWILGACGWWTANTSATETLQVPLELGEDEADAADDVVAGGFVGGERKELYGEVA